MAKKSFKNNPKAQDFLKELPEKVISTSNIEARCKFNFSYFDANQTAGQSYADWNANVGIDSLLNLIEKLENYTKESLNYWQNQRAGGGGLKVLEFYGDFPAKSDFKHPSHVPADAHWARFRLGNKVRLVGFVIHPSAICDLKDDDRAKYDLNTFYVVFLDKDHKFYKTEDD
ncbi:hypothetical protein KW437_21100 [Vibrio fluvialis]|nr:hypothetical protein [Vibrio fluvialis]EKO3999048.1 hypothetical protein [Vibrio fluvialis]ELE2165286.1 hypothetical protein [Vibrio fluvialis]MBY7784303.1 hypothetical protein [Vibrio fluvialis]